MKWAPYRIAMWLADHVSSRCCLCRLYFTSSPAFPCANDRNLQSNAPQSAALQPRRTAFQSRSSPRLLCDTCQLAMNWQPPSFTIDIPSSAALTITSASYYDYPLQPAITAFKHREDMTKLPFLVHALRQLDKPKDCHHSNSIIVPMPTTDSRLSRRGFDPVTILSHYLSVHWQIPIWQGVSRTDTALSQQGLSRSERLANLESAFIQQATPPVSRLLLFDDVATTGASLKALASELLTHDDDLLVSAYAIAHGNHVT